MSSITRITLALLIIIGSCLLLTGGIIRAIVVRSNLANPQAAPTQGVIGNVPPPDLDATATAMAGGPVEFLTPSPPVSVTDTPAPSNPAVDTGNAFMSAIQRNDFITAFTLLDSETVGQLQVADTLQPLMVGLSFTDIQSWLFTQAQVNGVDANLLGVLTRNDGTQVELWLQMRLNGNQWRVKWFSNQIPR